MLFACSIDYTKRNFVWFIKERKMSAISHCIKFERNSFPRVCLPIPNTGCLGTFSAFGTFYSRWRGFPLAARRHGAAKLSVQYFRWCSRGFRVPLIESGDASVSRTDLDRCRKIEDGRQQTTASITSNYIFF